MANAPEKHRPEKSTPANDAPVTDYNPWSFSLATLFQLMFLFAIVMAITVAVPPLGIGVAVVLIPALVRTAVIAKWTEKTDRRPPKFEEKIRIGIISMILSAVTLGASGIAFLIPCFGLGLVAFSMGYEKMDSLQMTIFGAGWIIGIGLGGFVFYWLAVNFWGKRDPEK